MNTVTAVPASKAQINFIAKLLGERDLSNYPMEKEGAARMVANGFITVPKSSASACITELLALPKNEAGVAVATKEAAPSPEVPEGRYAVEVGGTLKFYQVDRPTEGRWAGYTFVKVQASDDLHPLKGKTARDAVLAAIVAAGPEQASIRYGRELGVCGRCGKTLTDENSRAAGIGPICASKEW